MSKVMIDMEMPKSCKQCPLAVWIDDESYRMCTQTKEIVDFAIVYDKRHSKCPLREVKE